MTQSEMSLAPRASGYVPRHMSLQQCMEEMETATTSEAKKALLKCKAALCKAAKTAGVNTQQWWREAADGVGLCGAAGEGRLLRGLRRAAWLHAVAGAGALGGHRHKRCGTRKVLAICAHPNADAHARTADGCANARTYALQLDGS